MLLTVTVGQGLSPTSPQPDPVPSRVSVLQTELSVDAPRVSAWLETVLCLSLVGLPGAPQTVLSSLGALPASPCPARWVAQCCCLQRIDSMIWDHQGHSHEVVLRDTQGHAQCSCTRMVMHMCDL